MADKDNTQTAEARKASEASGDAGGAEVVHNVEMYTEPQIAPDGHVNLSKEDIKNRA